MSQGLWPLPEAGTAETLLPRASRTKAAQLTQEPRETPGPQSCQIIHLCCFTPWSLWWLVTAAAGAHVVAV